MTAAATADGADAGDAAGGAAVNPHYMERLGAVGDSHDIEASKDILARNGMKLLARGARVDPAVRERLLQHKLLEPLEDCIRIVGAEAPLQIGAVAEALLERHPLLRALCDNSRVQSVPVSLARLPLSVPVQTMLTVYGEHHRDRLEHTVGVAMLAFALARKLIPGAVDRQRELALAGLLHDIGELYIDPAHLRSGSAAGADAWRHIVAHPVVAHRVLRRMEGAGAEVAAAVLDHHERLDGFGYPRGLRGTAFAIGGQIVGAAEWQMALLESGRLPQLPSSIAARFIPGEFSAAVMAPLAVAARAGAPAGAAAPEAADQAEALEAAAPRVQRIADTLGRHAAAQAWLDPALRAASPALKAALALGTERLQQIRKAFSTTGLNAEDPAPLLRQLAAQPDPALHAEVLAVVRELEWRLRELERAQHLRAGLLPAAEAAVVHEWVARLRGAPPPPPAGPAADRAA